MAPLAFEYAVRTDPGPVRPHNEDAVFASPRLVAVADGVGGAAAGVVVGALDGGPDRRPTVVAHRARAGDRVLLCSDGLSDVVDEDAIAAALAIADRDGSAERLIALALGAGARDNVSVIVSDVVPGDPRISGWA